jgi:GNAT superfamily N-acetyltransferase
VVAPAPRSAAAEAVLTFLESVGRRSEAEFYLRMFHGLPKESFAVIVPGGPVVRSALGSIVEQLRFLADLGLYATVVLGLFDPETGASSSERLVKRLPVASLSPSRHAMSEPGLVDALREDLRNERIPVLHFTKEDDESLEQRLSRLGSLSQQLGTRKLALLRRRGGFRPLVGKRTDAQLSVEGGRISIINLTTDRGRIVPGMLSKRDTELLAASDRLIQLAEPNPLLVSITSPLNLLKELFTVKGAGTLVKRGSAVERHTSYSTVDVPRLRQLLESSFGKELAEGFFDLPPLAVYVDPSYRGAAIVHDAYPVPYLSKFAVQPEAQGEGIGRDIWEVLVRHHAQLYWRSRADNPIASWYVSVCDGMVRRPAWHVYFRGLAVELIAEAVAHAEARGPDFAAPAAPQNGAVAPSPSPSAAPATDAPLETKLNEK